MANTFSLETVYNCYNDRDGRKVSVGPDADALNLVEIIDHGETAKESKIRITLEPAHARIIAQALLKAADDADRATGKS